MQNSHLHPGSSSPAQAAGRAQQRLEAMSWPSVTRRLVTAPPPCWGTSPPPRLIPAGKANEAAKLPGPAVLSRELSLFALGEASWRGLSTATGWPGRAVPGCAGTAPAPNHQDNTGFVQISPLTRSEGGLTCLSLARADRLSFRQIVLHHGESRSASACLQQLRQGQGGGSDPEPGSGGGWPETGWICGWPVAAHGHFAGWGGTAKAIKEPVWWCLNFSARP